MAVFSFRHDAHLVPALIDNITPFVHGYVSFDDRAATGMLSDEPGRRNALHAAAREAGARWILAVDPDERYEAALADRIGEFTADPDGRTLWVFHLREMFSETAYRADGLWGNKTQMRLYPAQATVNPVSRPLHGSWVDAGPDYKRCQTGLNLYHLRHASPGRTKLRRDTYAMADPERRFTNMGYDYLADMRGAVLQEIGPKRAFTPPHVEDHGLWAMPHSVRSGDLLPDPREHILLNIAHSSRTNGQDGAAYMLQDLVTADPDDDDLRAVAATMTLLAGRPADALSILAPGTGNPSVLSLLTEMRAADQTDDKGRGDAALDAAQALAENDPMVSHAARNRPGASADLAADDAGWRRWTRRPATLHQGKENGSGRLCVIVVGYKAPPSLADVVAALRAQSKETEIVVVNSGGGNPAVVLNDHLHHIRLIEVRERLFVGAARNLGIDASRAPYVAFLADDCIPLDGWVAGRLARHDAGAMMVASAVLPARPDTLQGHLVRTLVFSRRHPDLNENEALMYGRSFKRRVFDRVGYFAPGLRVGEDTEFNRRATVLGPAVWAPEIVVRHTDPKSFLENLADIRLRARRYAVHIHRTGNLEATRAWLVDHRIALRERARVVLDQTRNARLYRRLELRVALSLGVRANVKGSEQGVEILTRAEDLALRAKSIEDSDLPGAIRLIEDALRLVPHDWRLWLSLGQLYMKQKDESGFKKARTCFGRAAEIAPGEMEPIVLTARELVRRGSKRWALDIWERSIIMAPNTAGRMIEAGRTARRAGLPEIARCLALRALVIDAAAYRAHELLAQLHAEAGRNELAARRDQMAKALRAFEDARKAKPA